MTAGSLTPPAENTAKKPVVASREPCAVFTVGEIRARFFPGRCPRWIKDTFKTGNYGPVFFDGGRWFISSEAVAGWQRAHRVCATTPADTWQD